MTNLLVIRSSATGAASVSNALIDGFLADAKAAAADISVNDRNLDTNPIDHIRAETLAGIGRPAPETEAAKPIRELSDALIAEVKAADVIVIGAPMYNFSLATTLRSWFDHVLRAGATFQYTENGPEGFLGDKRVIIVATRAGAYSEGEAAAMDFQIPYLRQLLAFVGITNVDVVLVEKLAFGEEAASASIAAGKNELSKLATSL
ncbi:MAG: FMN-dependent NADH-azoreductase [Sphingobium sp.]|nr:FMN-dependent NADH-azoreductase [Sphingobium sp.]